MEKFVQLTAVAARLPIVNLDTDRILSAVFLKRTGLAQSLFHEIRFRGDGSEERLACD
jgi:3-isopropylmalate/(R)-2-methylmalate dehydratase small subunit